MENSDPVKMYQYLFIHEPSEVIVKVTGVSQPAARTTLKDIVDSSFFTFPAGKWQFLGLGTPWPNDEEW